MCNCEEMAVGYCLTEIQPWIILSLYLIVIQLETLLLKLKEDQGNFTDINKMVTGKS